MVFAHNPDLNSTTFTLLPFAFCTLPFALFYFVLTPSQATILFMPLTIHAAWLRKNQPFPSGQLFIWAEDTIPDLSIGTTTNGAASNGDADPTALGSPEPGNGRARSAKIPSHPVQVPIGALRTLLAELLPDLAVKLGTPASTTVWLPSQDSGPLARQGHFQRRNGQREWVGKRTDRQRGPHRQPSPHPHPLADRRPHPAARGRPEPAQQPGHPPLRRQHPAFPHLAPCAFGHGSAFLEQWGQIGVGDLGRAALFARVVGRGALPTSRRSGGLV